MKLWPLALVLGVAFFLFAYWQIVIESRNEPTSIEQMNSRIVPRAWIVLLLLMSAGFGEIAFQLYERGL
jgi:hypothetical protein